MPVVREVARSRSWQLVSLLVRRCYPRSQRDNEHGAETLPWDKYVAGLEHRGCSRATVWTRGSCGSVSPCCKPLLPCLLAGSSSAACGLV